MLGDEAKLVFPSMVWIAVMPNKRRSEKIYSRYRLGNDVGVLKYFASYLHVYFALPAAKASICT